METTERKQFIEEFKGQWKSMWHNRVDDKVRAEGIADKDYSLLFVDKGTVIIATRKFKLLDFYELLQQHMPLANGQAIPPNPSTGGWGKFIRTTVMPQNLSRRKVLKPPEPSRHAGQQVKKGGRGWLHFKR